MSLFYPIAPIGGDDTPPVPPPKATASSFPEKLRTRYSDAYTAAHAVVRIGTIIKAIGVFLGFVIFIGGLVPQKTFDIDRKFFDEFTDVTMDSFGITSTSSVERTDDETHKALVESAAKGRAIGEKLGRDIWAGSH